MWDEEKYQNPRSGTQDQSDKDRGSGTGGGRVVYKVEFTLRAETEELIIQVPEGRVFDQELVLEICKHLKKLKRFPEIIEKLWTGDLTVDIYRGFMIAGMSVGGILVRKIPSILVG